MALRSCVRNSTEVPRQRAGKGEIDLQYRYIYSTLTTNRIAEDTLESIYDALHTAKATEAITETTVKSLLSILENDRGDLCCQFDVKVFCVILEITLRSEECRGSERVLVLLAVSTCHKACDFLDTD